MSGWRDTLLGGPFSYWIAIPTHGNIEIRTPELGPFILGSIYFKNWPQGTSYAITVKFANQRGAMRRYVICRPATTIKRSKLVLEITLLGKRLSQGVDRDIDGSRGGKGLIRWHFLWVGGINAHTECW